MTFKRSERSERYGEGLCFKMVGQTLICDSKVAYRTENNSHIAVALLKLNTILKEQNYFGYFKTRKNWSLV